jgi:ABC-2 type transport system ATP-binding protein
MASLTVIKIEGLSKSYGKTQALRHLNLEIMGGEFFGFLGPNGAGKTTTIKILSGQMKPFGGKAEVLGIDVARAIEVKRVIGIVPETVFLPSFLTVEEYLGFVCSIRKVSESKIDFWLDFTELGEERGTLCKDLSLGMKQKVSFSQAFIHEPRLVFLDEPFADVDPLMQNKMKGFLKTYVGGGSTIFLSTHILEIAEKLCSRVAIIDRGEIVRMGMISDLVKKGHDLEEVFLTLVKRNG